MLLAVLPFLLQLDLAADVRNTLPPDMARALERHNAIFGTADLCTSHGRADVQDAMQITGLSVLLSALTTLEGFGTLALSVHRGIASVGLVSLVGISACLLAALGTLPATLQL